MNYIYTLLKSLDCPANDEKNNAFWKTPHLMLYERTKHTERDVSFLRHYLRKIASKFITSISCNGKPSLA